MPRDHPLQAPGIFAEGETPTAVEVLGVTHAFTQTRMLDAREFAKAATNRGVRIEVPELESLHRRRLLVPLYSLHIRPVTAASRPSSTSAQDLRPSDASWFAAADVFRAYAEGRLRDPLGHRFRPWPKDLRQYGPRYSQFQLLSLRALAAHLPGGPLATTSQVWDSETRKSFTNRTIESASQSRALASVLEVLAPRYLPHIVGRVTSRGGEDALSALLDFTNSRDPHPDTYLLQQLDRAQLVRQAEALLLEARRFDPLGDWARVVRIATPQKADGLRFDALLAYDYRVAAEVLLRYVEDDRHEGDTDTADDLSTLVDNVHRDRLTVTPRERAATMMDYRLSDRPAVCIAVEGESEVLTVRRVLDLLGFDHRSPWVSVVDRRGMNANVQLLARAVAVPRLELDARRDDALDILLPLTALIVVNDPEGRFETGHDRSQVLEKMRRTVLESLPEPTRTRVDPGEFDYLLHVEAWDQEFEFAHFTDEELATGILALVDSPGSDHATLTADLRTCRGSGQNIKDVWRKWPYKPSKVQLAEVLWPTLEDLILKPTNDRPIPVLDLVERALEIADEVRTAGVMRARS